MRGGGYGKKKEKKKRGRSGIKKREEIRERGGVRRDGAGRGKRRRGSAISRKDGRGDGDNTSRLAEPHTGRGRGQLPTRSADKPL